MPFYAMTHVRWEKNLEHNPKHGVPDALGEGHRPLVKKSLRETAGTPKKPCVFPRLVAASGLGDAACPANEYVYIWAQGYLGTPTNIVYSI